jgi:hypothetical protein
MDVAQEGAARCGVHDEEEKTELRGTPQESGVGVDRRSLDETVKDREDK